MGNILPFMIFLPAAAALLVLITGRRNADAARWIALATTIATLVLAVAVTTRFDATEPTNTGPIQPQMELKYSWFDIQLPGSVGDSIPTARVEFYLGIDGISIWLVGLTALLMIPSVLVSWNSIKDRAAEFYALLLLLETAMLGVFCAFDLILFYIFFEFTLIPLFFIIGIWGGPQRNYAARKFFVYTFAGSVIALIGLIGLVLALQHQTGGDLTFSIPELARQMEGQMIETGFGQDAEVIEVADSSDLKAFWYSAHLWIFVALFLGFAIKVPLPPFHTWLPLAHTEAPTAGSVLLAGVLLKLGSYGFLRLCLPMLPYATWNIGVPLIALLSVIGIIYGALCALAQTDIKKLVAYSSVSHLGFCMLGLFALNSEGVAGGVMQMINHGLSTGGLFLIVGMLYDRYHTRRLQDLGGIASQLPLLSCFMVFMCLSSIGLPGLNGFVGEILSLVGMFKFHPVYAIIGATGIVLGAWYLLSMLQKAFFGPVQVPEGAEQNITDLDGREWAALLPIAIICLFIGIYPKPMIDTMQPAVDRSVKYYAHPEWLSPPVEVEKSE